MVMAGRLHSSRAGDAWSKGARLIQRFEQQGWGVPMGKTRAAKGTVRRLGSRSMLSDPSLGLGTSTRIADNPQVPMTPTSIIPTAIDLQQTLFRG
jgi:hypothetical protein